MIIITTNTMIIDMIAILFIIIGIMSSIIQHFPQHLLRNHLSDANTLPPMCFYKRLRTIIENIGVVGLYLQRIGISLPLCRSGANSDCFMN